MSRLVFLNGWAHTATYGEKLTLSPSKESLLLDTCELIAGGNIEQALEEQIDKPALLVGWSLGAMVAMQFAANYPDLVSKLILLSPTLSFVDEAEIKGVKKESVVALRVGIEKHGVAGAKKFLKDAYWPTQLSGETIELLLGELESAGVQSLLAGLDYLIEASIDKAARRIVTPTLIFHGTLDRIIPLQAGLEVATNIAGPVSVELLPLSGHELLSRSCEQVATTMERFIGAE